MRGEYSHLVTCPHLILEQLLMNMKVKVNLAGNANEAPKNSFKSRPFGRFAKDDLPCIDVVALAVVEA